jgi:hypothetical protein
MRTRDAWLAAIAAALGISEDACRHDAAPQLQQVASAAASSIAPIIALTAPSASADVAPSASTNAIASASATPNATAAPNASALLAILSKQAPTTMPQDMQAICGASVQTRRQNIPGNGSCGAIPSNMNRFPGNGSCGGVGAPLQPQTAHPAAVVSVSLTSGAAGDDHVAAALRPRFRNCANQALAQDPSQQGKLVIAAAVAANGEVTTAAVASNTGLSGNSAQCMARIVRNAQFPAGAARTIMIAIVQTKQSP